jgi:thiol-disulfide isomerase/thioredoxin
MHEAVAGLRLTALTMALAIVLACAPAVAADSARLTSLLSQLPVLTLDEDSTNVARLIGPVRDGERVVLFFWSTYDRFSREELPAVVRFYREHRADRSVHLLTLNLVEMREGVKTVKGFLAKEAPDLPVALDPSWRALQRLQRLARREGGAALGLPTLAVLDADGEVIAFHRGATGRTYDILVRASAVKSGGARRP